MNTPLPVPVMTRTLPSQLITRITIANVTPEQVAASTEGTGLSGTIFPSLGFGPWGIEPGATVELAHAPGVLQLIRWWIVDYLGRVKEKAAYVTIEGSPRLWWADGRVTTVDGSPMTGKILEVVA